MYLTLTMLSNSHLTWAPYLFDGVFSELPPEVVAAGAASSFQVSAGIWWICDAICQTCPVMGEELLELYFPLRLVFSYRARMRYIYGVYTVFFAGNSSSIRSYTAYLYGSGQLLYNCTSLYVHALSATTIFRPYQTKRSVWSCTL